MGEKTRVAAAAGGALGLSGFAAALGLCCSVPWAVALLGVAGAVAFARLAFLLPYALIAAIALLAVGFWWAYRRRPVACDDGTCTAESRRPLQWVVWIAALLVVALASVAFAPRAMSAPRPYTVLDDSASHLRDDFNRAKGSVRLLFVVDPICPGCLRGLDEMNDSLLSKTNDPRIRTFVVHVPVIGAKAKDVAPAGKLLQNSNVQSTTGTRAARLVAHSRRQSGSSAVTSSCTPGTCGSSTVPMQPGRARARRDPSVSCISSGSSKATKRFLLWIAMPLRAKCGKLLRELRRPRNESNHRRTCRGRYVPAQVPAVRSPLERNDAQRCMRVFP